MHLKWTVSGKREKGAAVTHEKGNHMKKKAQKGFQIVHCRHKKTTSQAHLDNFRMKKLKNGRSYNSG